MPRKLGHAGSGLVFEPMFPGCKVGVDIQLANVNKSAKMWTLL